jgi:hypothetical protein
MSWQGDLLARAVLPAAHEAVTWRTWAPGPDGAFYAAGFDPAGQGFLGRFPRGESAAAEVVPLVLTPDARLIAFAEGVALRSTGGDFELRGDLSPQPTQVIRNDFDWDWLDARTGSRGFQPLDGDRAIKIQVEDGVVFALLRMPGDPEHAPSVVARVTEWTPGQEDLLRGIAEGPDGRLILTMEGSMQEVKLLLSPDGGLSWIGARAGW